MKATVIETSPVILAHEAMFLFNNQLWILQGKTGNIFFGIQHPDGKYLYSTESRGRGPNEFITPFGHTLQVHNDKTITLLDGFTMKT